MITDIPTPEEILNVGLRFISTAWGDTLNTAIQADDAPFDDGEGENPKPEDFWKLARNDLAVALATVQQGVEFLLKAEIARFSPFLLVSQEPAKWPKGCDKENVKFADFRSIDSQDLIRVYNTVAHKKLPVGFVTRFESMRKHRNVIFHSVPTPQTTAVADIVEAVLDAVNTLVEPFAWPRLRKSLLSQSPWSLFSGEWTKWDPDVVLINEELEYVLGILEPAAARRLLRIDKKQRFYACPECYYGYYRAKEDGSFKLAQLKPKGSASNSLFCVACEGTYDVVRKKCEAEDCKGNVLSEDGLCLTCTNNQ
jgi:hypothetical protein